MLVSVIIPVGLGYSGLDECLESFVWARSENYEIILGIDEGDEKNLVRAIAYQNKLPIKIVTWKGEKSYQMMHEKSNELAKEAQGEFIWWLSDEVRIITENWADRFIRFRSCSNVPTLIQPTTRPVAGAKYPAINRIWYERTGQFAGHASLDSWLNTLREMSCANEENVGIIIYEKERPTEETRSGKRRGTGEEWNLKRLYKRLKSQSKKLNG